MNNRINLLIALIIGVFIFFASCSGSEDLAEDPETPDLITPNNNVLKAFNERHPNAKDVSWSEEDDYYVADFRSDSRSAIAWFNEQGVWLLDQTKTSYGNLQNFVTSTLSNTSHSDWGITDAYVLDRKGFNSVYLVGIGKNNKKANLYYTQNGDLIKIKDDVDNNIESPTSIPTQLQATINQLFTKPQLVDIWWNDLVTSDINVGIIDELAYKLVILDEEYSWVSTFWDLTDQTMPVHIMDGFVSSRYGVNEIDSMKAMQNDEGLSYLFYFKDKDRDNEEAVATLDENGDVKYVVHY